MSLHVSSTPVSAIPSSLSFNPVSSNLHVDVETIIDPIVTEISLTCHFSFHLLYYGLFFINYLFLGVQDRILMLEIVPGKECLLESLMIGGSRRITGS